MKKLWPWVKTYRTSLGLALLFTMAGALLAQVTPLVMEYSVNRVQEMLNHPVPARQVWTIVGGLVAILLGKECLSLGVQLGQKFVSDRLRFRLGADLYDHSIRRVVSYHLFFFSLSQNQTGRLEKRIDKGIESLTKTVKNLFVDIIPMLANAALALLIIYNKNYWVGIVATLILPLYAYISREQSHRQKQIRRGIQTVREEKAQALFGLLESIFVVKSFVREKYESGRQQVLNLNLCENEIRHHRTNYLFDGLKSIAEQLGVVLVFVVTIYFVLQQQMTIGAILLHLMLFNNVSAPVRHLHRIYDEYTEALTYAEGFFDMIENDTYLPSQGTLTAPDLRGEFVMKDVDFVYPNGKQALSQVNLRLAPGKTTALVGLSGAGKSSAMNLLAGFFEPTRGQVLLDGQPIAAYDSDFVRQNVGLVMQKNHIFGGTIEENIRYGKLDATAAEVEEAARKASLHEQIMQLPEGYASEARALSGGQQQRIAIARLFLKNPPILFLDEPTASLDAITSEQIKDSLDAIKKGRTVLIISHAISQIMDADQIYVLKDGHLIGEGTHESLYQSGGLYREIIESNARTLNLGRLAATVLG
ncbi:ABC-type multidrug transport system fused ATPase/permease subunit [Rhabdobacter roseus]|uniref:ABC-type multidrug transport system fused ATPase/permease subunit n=1 Tax=Rhabdobacter roseus TaxID=1655419 RepID=A0A840TIY4_9BACT|nr:ABC transporter ATP-binding protein [Rhabdobacter roseus]MBB5283331.1 ABC-type multidrug transport system fused ATPase/permease subunit [Rhabdobacter roseus]